MASQALVKTAYYESAACYQVLITHHAACFKGAETPPTQTPTHKLILVAME